MAACGSSRKELQHTDRKEVLHSIAINTILPSFEAFAIQTDSLLAAAAHFSENPEAGSLEILRNQWKATALTWKKAGVYSFGPVEDNFLAGPIDYPSVHYPNIEKSIQTTTTIDDDYINSRGTSLKGLKALEYLLFKEEDPGKTVAEFTSSPQRRAYLVALSYNLTAQAAKIMSAWNDGDSPYRETFIQAGGRDIKSGISMLVNKCIHQVNFIRDEHLAAPMGMRNNGEKQPELVQGRLSNTSIALLKSELDGVRACLEGDGLNALLDQLDAQYEGTPLSKALSDQFREIGQAADHISLPLDQAIFDEPDKVTRLYDELKKLQILLEVDVVNQLGIILTFSDNDGD